MFNGESLLESACDLSGRQRIHYGLVMACEFMHLNPTHERLPCRWTPVQDAVQIACHLRGVEIQQIAIYVARYVPARHSQIVEDHRRQATDELRVALLDFTRQLDGALDLWDRPRAAAM